MGFSSESPLIITYLIFLILSPIFAILFILCLLCKNFLKNDYDVVNGDSVIENDQVGKDEDG